MAAIVEPEMQPFASETKPTTPIKTDDRRSVICSVLAIVVSLPGLIGACCWPALVIGILSGTVSAAARRMGHVIALSITSTMMAVLLAYTLYKTRDRRRPFCRKFGPFLCICVATVLIVADPLRHVLMDHKDLPQWFGQYRADCNAENLSCLSAAGALFVTFTYVGFTFLVIGTLWNANFLDKMTAIRNKWRELRGGVNEEEQESITQPLFSDNPMQYGTNETTSAAQTGDHHVGDKGETV